MEHPTSISSVSDEAIRVKYPVELLNDYRISPGILREYERYVLVVPYGMYCVKSGQVTYYGSYREALTAHGNRLLRKDIEASMRGNPRTDGAIWGPLTEDEWKVLPLNRSGALSKPNGAWTVTQSELPSAELRNNPPYGTSFPFPRRADGTSRRVWFPPRPADRPTAKPPPQIVAKPQPLPPQQAAAKPQPVKPVAKPPPLLPPQQAIVKPVAKPLAKPPPRQAVIPIDDSSSEAMESDASYVPSVTSSDSDFYSPQQSATPATPATPQIDTLDMPETSPDVHMRNEPPKTMLSVSFSVPVTQSTLTTIFKPTPCIPFIPAIPGGNDDIVVRYAMYATAFSVLNSKH